MYTYAWPHNNYITGLRQHMYMYVRRFISDMQIEPTRKTVYKTEGAIINLTLSTQQCVYYLRSCRPDCCYKLSACMHACTAHCKCFKNPHSYNTDKLIKAQMNSDRYTYVPVRVWLPLTLRTCISAQVRPPISPCVTHV